MSDKKAIRIEVRYDDGSVSVAEGRAAETIMRWYASCEVMNLIHGAVYSGPHFKVTEPPVSTAEAGKVE